MSDAPAMVLSPGIPTSWTGKELGIRRAKAKKRKNSSLFEASVKSPPPVPSLFLKRTSSAPDCVLCLYYNTSMAVTADSIDTRILSLLLTRSRGKHVGITQTVILPRK